MRIPWVPLEQGGGNIGATLAYQKFVGADGQPDYGTAMNAVERKAFQNLPMPTKDAMKIQPVKLHNGPPKGTGVRHNHPEGAGENYVDSFVTHPVAGNYQTLFNQLDEQAKAAEKEKIPSLTLEMVAAQGYRNLGLNADAEHMNNLRDRLRYAGMSDEEIEVVLKEARIERLKKKASLEMIPEQRQVYEAQRMAEAMGVNAEEVDVNFGAQPFHDANVFNFGIPAPSEYSGFLLRQGPENNIFSPRAKPPTIAPRHGVHDIHEIEPPHILHPRARPPIHVNRSGNKYALALSGHLHTRGAPERSILSHEESASKEFLAAARNIYLGNYLKIQKQKEEYEIIRSESSDRDEKKKITKKINNLKIALKDNEKELKEVESAKKYFIKIRQESAGQPKKGTETKKTLHSFLNPEKEK